MKAIRGFSLIEVLIAISILGGISIVLSQSFFTITRSNTKAELVKDMKQSGDFAVRVLEQMIRANIGISSTCAAGGSTSSQLSITNPDAGQTSFLCVWDGANGVTRLASRSGALTSYLTPSNVTLGGSGCSDSGMTLRFECTSFPSQPSTVTLTFTLSQAGVPVDRFERASVPFQTTVNVRN